MITSYQKTELFPVIWYLKYHSSWTYFYKHLTERMKFGVIQTCFKFQIFLTDLIPGFNTSKFLKKLAIIKKVSFRFCSSFPPHWKKLLSLHCCNVFIVFNSFVHTLLGIAFLCLQGFEIVKVGSSMYAVSRAFFSVCFLSCARHSVRGRHSCCLACLHSHIITACLLQLWIKTSDLDYFIWATCK